ncbi:MAG: hypothetical protein MJ069_10740 [Salinivirgaceae bacterium]|nr:hypothetical protein [Salinivirgaceae bacterium]
MSDYTDWCLKCELDEVGERVLKDVILSTKKSPQLLGGFSVYINTY